MGAGVRAAGAGAQAAALPLRGGRPRALARGAVAREGSAPAGEKGETPLELLEPIDEGDPEVTAAGHDGARLPMAHAGMAADEGQQRRYFEAGEVYRLQLESTLSCPQRCDYCYTGSLPHSPHGLASPVIQQRLEAAARAGVQVIDWLGGDPLVRPDWFALCAQARRLGLVNNIWTSGLPLANPAVARRAVEATQGGFLSVHLDTLDLALYARLHGERGRYAEAGNIDRILRGVQNCLAAGKAPGAMANCITFTREVARPGAGDARHTIEHFYQAYGIKTCLTLHKPAAAAPCGAALSDWQPTAAEIKDTYRFRDALYPDDPPVGAMDVSKFYCGSMVCVKADGWLVPCSVIRTREFGNIHEEELGVLVQRHRRRLLFLDFRRPEALPGRCRDCASNTACFGCRSNAFYLAGDVCAEDPTCQSYCRGG